MKRYKHRWTYWIWAIVYFILAGMSLYVAILDNKLYYYLFCLCCIGLATRELYWFFKNNPSNGAKPDL